MNRLLIIVIALFAAFIAWQVSVTRARREAVPVATETAPPAPKPPSPEAGCRVSATEALAVWGRNRMPITMSPPPYDLNRWPALRSGIDEKIDAADKACQCEAESCTRIRTAMLDLRSLVSDFDASIRNGLMPEDFHGRQQTIGAKVSGSEYPPEKKLHDALSADTPATPDVTPPQ